MTANKQACLLPLCLLLLSSEVYASPVKKLTFQVVSGYIRAVDTNSRTVWKVNTGSENVLGVERKESDLFVTLSNSLLCIDPKNGRKKWKIHRDYESFSQKATVCKDVVLVTFWASGAYLHCRTNAFDRSTGRLLWDQVGELKRADASQVLLERRFPYPDPKPHDIVTTVLVERRTGKEIRVVRKSSEVQPTPGPMPRSPLLK